MCMYGVCLFTPITLILDETTQVCTYIHHLPLLNPHTHTIVHMIPSTNIYPGQDEAYEFCSSLNQFWRCLVLSNNASRSNRKVDGVRRRLLLGIIAITSG